MLHIIVDIQRSIMRASLLCIVFLAGCSLTIESERVPEDLPIQTDKTTYIAQLEQEGSRPRYGFDLVARFENSTNKTIYLARCYPDSPFPMFYEARTCRDEVGCSLSDSLSSSNSFVVMLGQ